MHILSVSGVRQCLLQQNKQTYFSLCILMDSANHSFKNSLNENLLPLYFVWQLITNISSISFCGSFSSPLKILAFKEPNSNEFHRLNVWSKKKVLHFFFLVSNSFSISSRRNKEKKSFPLPSFILSLTAYDFLAPFSPGCRVTAYHLLLPQLQLLLLWKPFHLLDQPYPIFCIFSRSSFSFIYLRIS